MTQYLPPNLLALFAPRDPLPFIAPLDKLPWEKKLQPYSGVAQFIQEFEDPKDTPPPTRVETKEERKERKRKERAEQVAYKLEQDLALWVPGGEPHSTTDPFKTLFVTRVNYDTSESKLRREFEVYGQIRKIHLVTNQRNGKPRGYAFIEYEHERDMHSAYKHADGKKLDGRRVLVDVERGRTIKGWRSRRLGGGLGGTRKGGPDVNTKYSGREDSNIRDDRSRSRSPAAVRRGGRGGRRSRSHSPRERPRRRSRSRERRRSRERDRGDDRRDRGGDREEETSRKRSRRSRSRERRRSRSRERKRSKRSRSRDRIKRERDPDRDRDREEKPVVEPLPINEPEESESYVVLNPNQIKAEPVKEGYDKYAGSGEGQYPYRGGDKGNGFNEQQEYNGEAQEQRQEEGDGDGEEYN